jgi:2-dehydro-3-deoxyglucarate aldolase
MNTINYAPNSLKDKLSNKSLTIGSWVTIPSTEIIEILSTAGFEWLVIDLEHTSITLSEAKNLIQTIQANGMNALVRVSSNNETEIKKVLDIGANGIIVPMIKSKEEIEQAVSFTQYPPNGVRGVGLNRVHKYGTGFKEYKESSQSEIVVIAQIEHIDAVNKLEDILSCPGLDGTIVGPYDLSASMGHPGDYNRDDVLEALQKVESTTLASNKSLGFHVIESDHSYTLQKINQGYTFLAFSMDFFFLGDLARNEMNILKRKIK